ncbi:MAG TPA: chromosome segregation protein SMC [Steroidobacteraceae bacterium]|jgi:chromosome segregation protein|nr:chromosome segregation protein SMC [Steroidobacteraceae bacterium]
MRLTKIKLAGFKTFVDPTSVGFPGNLTGVVGPNGCGKSNIIDAVRWVMGELSAKHLRGDSMADVVFNGSSARKPVGSASVELVFDNSDGRISGAYAGYNEVSLKRLVSRDGSSNYYINGARCRRRDITQLFLGTGLGSRSYSIIEQGMISRVIEAKPEDMRAFIEEAAGISRYKERRRETEARVADTRENLERLQDVRDEVDRQIRHLQRQAGAARRYQALKDQERRALAELLALKIRDLDSGAQIQDSALRERDVVMQAALADQRGAEAALERQRAIHGEHAEGLAAVQGRHYEIGADITRTGQSLQHTREMRERQRNDLTKAREQLAELAALIERDEQQLAALRHEIATLQPQGAEAARLEQVVLADQAQCEHELAQWQQRWDQFMHALAAANQATQVESARIEQLENQLGLHGARGERLSVEQEQLSAQDPGPQLSQLVEAEAQTRTRNEELGRAQSAAAERVQALRQEQHSAESQLDGARIEREKVRGELVALEAVQKAALSHNAPRAGEWLNASGLAARERVAQQLDVADGWERAVETALGDYLEAVCVERLEDVEADLGKLSAGRIALVEQEATDAATYGAESLAAKIHKGPAAIAAQLAGVLAGESLGDALRMRDRLEPGQSIITRAGEWVGKGWIRVSRGQDPHTGVIEREHRLKTLRLDLAHAEGNLQRIDGNLGTLRRAQAEAETRREQLQSAIHTGHREHSDARSQLEAARARAVELQARRTRLEHESAQLARERAAAHEAVEGARAALSISQGQLAELESRRPQLETERDERREALTNARQRAQSAQVAARDLLIRIESRRSQEGSIATGLGRMADQRAQVAQRCAELDAELADGDAPITQLQGRLDVLLSRRLEVESELDAARRGLEEADARIHELDQQRSAAEARVAEARDAIEQARLAAQESRVRREALAEQFVATQYDLSEITQGLAAQADVATWEDKVNELRADVARLGQVNLAAIDELKEQTERKEYLDRQHTDLTDALATLEEAMHKIDKETRTRFEDTFEKINTGLKEKFPRLFGGGHAYLELVGDDILAAGVAVMARPPGKRNSTIHLLSGGEKALTAVALVFSIFDLNPAPFCLLDEVDAPLDEHNVGRFCEIVREMSQRVQFIFITHNKATMELASQLIGVTMTEPGVSRLVAVDVEEAVRLAAV